MQPNSSEIDRRILFCWHMMQFSLHLRYSFKLVMFYVHSDDIRAISEHSSATLDVHRNS